MRAFAMMLSDGQCCGADDCELLAAKKCCHERILAALVRQAEVCGLASPLSYMYQELSSKPK